MKNPVLSWILFLTASIVLIMTGCSDTINSSAKTVDNRIIEIPVGVAK